MDHGLRDLDSLDDLALHTAYATPREPWWRLNFVSTVDGAVTGQDGLSKSIQNAADQRVFELLRAWCDVLVVGAGTVRDEGYRPNNNHLVLVSRHGSLPPSLLEGPLDKVWMATGARAPELERTRALLGERCLVLGESGPDLTRLADRLHTLGFARVLCEGGPALAADLLAAGLVDELCLTVVPSLVAGDPHRLLRGPAVDVRLELAGMLHSDSTLLQRWLVDRARPAVADLP